MEEKIVLNYLRHLSGNPKYIGCYLLKTMAFLCDSNLIWFVIAMIRDHIVKAGFNGIRIKLLNLFRVLGAQT